MNRLLDAHLQLADVYAGIDRYYSAKLEKYGATPLGVDWAPVGLLATVVQGRQPWPLYRRGASTLAWGAPTARLIPNRWLFHRVLALKPLGGMRLARSARA